MWSRRHLGHGVGLRVPHFAELLEHGPGRAPGVDWFEIISENFFEPGGRPWAVLEKVRREVPVVMHGVSMGIGNADPVPDDYLDQLVATARRCEPAWISDHLCWGGFGGHYAHDLLPLPYTEEALAHVAGQVDRVQERLGRPLMLENVSSYVELADSAMTEWEFLAELARRTDCGILLDVNNVYVSARNHGFDPRAYVAGIPPERVGQLHLAGHTDHGAYVVDTHVGPVPDPVWALYQDVVRHVGPVATLIEWDEGTPDLATVAAEARRAAALEAEVGA